MPRKKEYIRPDVLKKAAALFWEKGFEAASMDDLAERTGLNAFSMYREFGSKNGLFAAAMDSYYQSQLMTMTSSLRLKTGLSAIRDFFRAFPGIISSSGYTGCLYMNTLVEKSSVDPAAFSRASGFCAELSRLLEKCVRDGQKKGEITKRKNAKTLANYLLCVVLGVTLYGRTRPGEKMAENVISAALKALKP